jgi:hypothetical protein
VNLLAQQAFPAVSFEAGINGADVVEGNGRRVF